MRITEKTTDLNVNEIKVLKAISIASDIEGGDFTYFKYVMKKLEGLTERQVKGYISQLSQKDFIEVEIGTGMIFRGVYVDFLTDYEF